MFWLLQLSSIIITTETLKEMLLKKMIKEINKKEYPYNFTKNKKKRKKSYFSFFICLWSQPGIELGSCCSWATINTQASHREVVIYVVVVLKRWGQLKTGWSSTLYNRLLTYMHTCTSNNKPKQAPTVPFFISFYIIGLLLIFLFFIFFEIEVICVVVLGAPTVIYLYFCNLNLY